MNVINLTKELISISSPAGDEKKIGEYLVERLKKNFVVKTQNVGDRFNILATKGNPRVLLTIHMDTVPKELEIHEDNDWIYGRGACDAKGPLACMICACEEAVEEGIEDFGMLFDVSEETDFSGIAEAINLVDPEYVIVGEPTDLKIVFGQKGLIQIKIKCYGKSAHGSIPDRGISAINELIKILSDINNLELPKDKFLGNTTINIGTISGGISACVVPDYAEAVIEIRATKPSHEILDIIRSVVPDKSFEIIFNYERVLNENLDFISNLNFEKITVPFFTEMYFWASKSKTIVFAPGSIEYAHTDYEKIRKEDLIMGKDYYKEMIKDFLKNS